MKINENEVSKMMLNGNEVHGRRNCVDIEDGIITDGLVAWFSPKDFSNEDATTTLKDRSGNGNDGTCNGFAYTSESGLRMECIASGKNLISNSKNHWANSSIVIASGLAEYSANRLLCASYIPVTSSTTYTISCDSGYSVYIMGYSEDSNATLLNWSEAGGTFTTNSTTVTLRIILKKNTEEDLTTDILQSINIQLEEGSVATDYEPFKGTVEKSVVFDGVDDYVTLNSDGLSSSLQNFSVEVFIKTPSVFGNKRIITKRYEDGGYSYSITLRSGTIGGMIRTAEGYKGTLNLYDAIANTKYHIVQTYNGSEYNFYINGVQIEQIYCTGDIIYDTNKVFIGKYNMELFDGKIYSVSTYTKALTSDEVLQNHNALMGV